METFKKILAVISSIGFVLTAVLALILFNVDRRAFQAEAYQRVLEGEGFYERIPTLMAEAVVNSPSETSGLPLVMQGMSVKAWDDLFRTMLPPDELKKIGDNTLASMFDFLNMQADSVKISFAPIKSQMASDAGVQAVYTLLNTQPDCTIEQVASMTISLLVNEGIEFCKPPESLYPLLTPVINLQLETAAFAIPDETTLFDAQIFAAGEDPRIRLQNLRLLMQLSLFLPIGFLLLLTLTSVNSLKTFLKSWGVPFLSTGLIAVLIAASGAPILGFILKRLAAQRAGQTLPSSISAYANDLVTAMIGAITRPILWQAILIFFIGTGLLTGLYFVNKQESKTVQ
jgi:hypothetical protein